MEYVKVVVWLAGRRVVRWYHGEEAELDAWAFADVMELAGAKIVRVSRMRR